MNITYWWAKYLKSIEKYLTNQQVCQNLFKIFSLTQLNSKMFLTIVNYKDKNQVKLILYQLAQKEGLPPSSLLQPGERPLSSQDVSVK